MTGRLPHPPEVQRLPPRTELGKQVTAAITREKLLRESPPLIDVDYAALELRCLAALKQG